MISIVCVFNNKQVLEQRLCQSLKKQNCIYDLVTIDNRENKYHSAAKALNHGARLAAGDWIIFAHQDIEFLSNDWIKNAESMLNDFNPTGWVGVAGRDDKGVFKGFMIDRSSLFGHMFYGFEQVQTLDECILIHKRLSEGESYFDEGIPGWHAYGVDACCVALTNGKPNYVISLPVWHDSPSTNLAGLNESHEYVWEKHRSMLRVIYTTCGILADKEARPKNKITFRNRIVWRIKKYHRVLFGVRDTKIYTFADKLESLTSSDDTILCLHSEYWMKELRASAFIPQPEKKRFVCHTFTGLNSKSIEADCIVVWYDLSVKISLNVLRKYISSDFPKKLIICINLEHLWVHPLMWRKIINHANYSCFTFNNNIDSSHVLIISL